MFYNIIVKDDNIPTLTIYMLSKINSKNDIDIFIKDMDKTIKLNLDNYGIYKLDIILECKGIKLYNLDVNLAKIISSICTRRYPKILNKLSINNCPNTISPVIKTILKLFDNDVSKKLIIN